jgi:chromosome segregation ATPase
MIDENDITALDAKISELEQRIRPLREELQRLKRLRRPLTANLASRKVRTDKAEERNNAIRADFFARAIRSFSSDRPKLPYGEMKQFAKDHKISQRMIHSILRRTFQNLPASYVQEGDAPSYEPLESKTCEDRG